MKSKARPQYVKDIVEEANQYFRLNKVKYEDRDNLFWFILNYLSSRKMYNGYTFYKEVYDETIQCNKLVIAGTDNPNQYDCIQFF